MSSGDLAGRTVLAVHPGAEMFGSDRMLLESVIGMVEGGARVIVALPSCGPLADHLRDAGAQVVTTPAFVLRKALLKPSGWMRLITDLVRGLGASWRLLGRLRPDVVYASTIIEPLWPLLGRMHRVPVVTHVHEAQASGSRLVSLALYLPHAPADRLITNSRFSTEAIARVLPGVARRARIVLNGVEGPQDPPAPRPALDGPVRLVYVGRLSPRKGPDLLLDAARTLADQGVPVDVTLVGEVFTGYEWFADQLHAKAADMPQVPVTFTGFDPDIWPRLARADLMVVPSRQDEPFGNTVVEGVLAMRPVIAADQGGLREAAGGYPTTRLVAVDDAAAIAAAIREIGDNWPEVVDAVPRARAEAGRRHAPEVYRAGVLEVVAGAADSRRRRS